MYQNKVVVIDEDQSITDGLSAAIGRQEETEFAGHTDNGAAAADLIRELQPDIVILDLILPGMDGIDIMKSVKKSKDIYKKPLFIVVSATGDDDIVRKAFLNGAKRFIKKPFDPDYVAEKAVEVCRERTYEPVSVSVVAEDNVTQYGNAYLENDISNLIKELGVPANVKGYHYLRDAVMISMTRSGAYHSVTKMVYPEVARKYDTTPSRVERAIRHAVDTAWIRGSMGAFQEIFGYTIDSHRGKPTNSEFIAIVADKLRMTYKRLK